MSTSHTSFQKYFTMEDLISKTVYVLSIKDYILV